MELAVFVGRAAKLVHHFRTHRVRRRSYKLEVVLNRFLKQKPAGLSIALGDVRKTFVETDVHLKSNFLGWLLGHREGLCQEITRRKRIILENSRIVYHPMEVVFFSLLMQTRMDAAARKLLLAGRINDDAAKHHPAFFAALEIDGARERFVAVESAAGDAGDFFVVDDGLAIQDDCDHAAD
jgi:hypothetical protein